ncbi:class I SAM-dependent RNA methyltransferase [Myxococcota bacterium]
MGLAPEEQVRHKQTELGRLFATLSKSPSDPPWRHVQAGNGLGYRNRIRLRIASSGEVQFFNPHKTFDCAVLEPSLRMMLPVLREWSQAHGATLVEFAHLEVRAADLDGHCGALLTPRDATRPLSATARGALSALRSHCLVAVAGEPEMPRQRYPLTRLVHQSVPLDGFVQINWAVNARLVDHVVLRAHERRVRTFADLYCGSGNFALALLAGGLRGVAIESHRQSIEAARHAAQTQGLPGGVFEVNQAISYAQELQTRGHSYDMAVVDPPRAGVRFGLEALSALSTGWLVMCSCNPRTLVRDLIALTGLGWALEEVTTFDMFPQTRHLEVVVWLRKQARDPR